MRHEERWVNIGELAPRLSVGKDYIYRIDRHQGRSGNESAASAAPSTLRRGWVGRTGSGRRHSTI